MKQAEAISVCEDWFAHIDRQRARAVEMQQLAVLARTEPEKAQRRLRQLDMQSVVVFDGGRLEPAVRALVDLARQPQRR